MHDDGTSEEQDLGAKGRLSGVRVLVTRPATSAPVWCAALERAGATVIVHPTTVVAPPPSWAPLDEAVARLESYDWLIFTSAAAVNLTCARLPAHVDPATLDRPRIAAVGEETARALAARHFRVAFVPGDQRQEGLAEGLLSGAPADPLVAAGARVLFPRALDGRDHLVDAFRAAGVEVDLVPVSQTIALAGLTAPPPFDVATFASPSALTAWVDRLGTGTIAAVPCVVIGATTAAAARAHGLAPVTASAPNIGAVIDAIVIALSGRHDAPPK